VLNTIEFWTGQNPIVMEPGEKNIDIITKDDKSYENAASLNQIDITQVKGDGAGQSVSVVYDPESKAWYLVSESRKQMIAIHDPEDRNILNIIKPDGRIQKVAVQN
jgi:hypothetical protein